MPRKRIHRRIILSLTLIAVAAAPIACAQMPGSASDTDPVAGSLPLRSWGEEALAVIERDLRVPDTPFYAEDWQANPDHQAQPAFMWGAGVQLTALAAAASVEPERHIPSLRSFADALQHYWVVHDGIGGFDVLPGPKPVDRYYDDNVWIVLGLTETYELTGDDRYLEEAEATFAFVMSGEDDVLGGGIYWHEQGKETKNTCSNAPSVVAALRLYQVTAKPEYLETAERLYAWTNRWLQDPSDGLYWDNVALNGEVDERKYTYNTALMIRANALFHAVTGEASYLGEAQRIARAAEAHWLAERDEGIAIADGGRFAHMLLEAFLAVEDQDSDPRWSAIAQRTLAFVHAQVRDPHGRYANRWDRPQDEPLQRLTLLDAASTARAFWVLAGRTSASS